MNAASDRTSDPVARTKADPNRSYREDALVAEIERLRSEKAITADLLRYHLEKSQVVGWRSMGTARAGYLSSLSKTDLIVRVEELLAAESLHVAQIERLRLAAVKAVMPLEVIRISGWDKYLTEETRQAVADGIEAVAECSGVSEPLDQTVIAADKCACGQNMPRSVICVELKHLPDGSLQRVREWIEINE